MNKSLQHTTDESCCIKWLNKHFAQFALVVYIVEGCVNRKLSTNINDASLNTIIHSNTLELKATILNLKGNLKRHL